MIAQKRALKAFLKQSPIPSIDDAFKRLLQKNGEISTVFVGLFVSSVSITFTLIFFLEKP
jgi:hypothetical protein